MISPIQRLITRLLRFFSYLLYQPMAWTYDWVAAVVSLGRWQKWVLTILPDLDGPLVLELGHGPGHLQLALCEKGIQVYGLDRSCQMGKIARQRLMQRGYIPNLINGYAQHMPWPPASFDQVVATFPAEFIAEPVTLSEIRRVLKPDGRLVILPVAWITGQSLPDRFARWLFWITGQAPDPDNHTFYDRLGGQFAQAGFHVDIQRRTVNASKVLVLLARKSA